MLRTGVILKSQCWVIKRLGWLKEFLAEMIKEGFMVFWQVSG